MPIFTAHPVTYGLRYPSLLVTYCFYSYRPAISSLSKCQFIIYRQRRDDRRIQVQEDRHPVLCTQIQDPGSARHQGA